SSVRYTSSIGSDAQGGGMRRSTRTAPAGRLGVESPDPGALLWPDISAVRRRRPAGRWPAHEFAPTGRGMQPDKVLLTREGRARLLAELEELRTTKRAEVAERLRVSREEGPGDAGDNTQYLETQRELALLEGRIATIERTLAQAQLVEQAP